MESVYRAPVLGVALAAFQDACEAARIGATTRKVLRAGEALMERKTGDLPGTIADLKAGLEEVTRLLELIEGGRHVSDPG